MPDPASRLVDSRLGVVRRLLRQRPPPEVSPGYVAYLSEVADTSRVSGCTVDRYGFGGAFFDEQRARGAALGEAVERYCGNLVPTGLERASYRDLAANDRQAVRPDSFILYAPEQYSTPGFPFTPLTPELPLRWTSATDLGSGTETLVPASMVWINYHCGRDAYDPPTHSVMLPGIAAGTSRNHAERSALEELIERDATTIWWHSDSPAIGVDLDGAPAVKAALVTDLPLGYMRYHCIAIPTVFDVPVIGVLLEDTRRQIVAFGTACRARAEDAALKAAAEAVHVYMLSRTFLDQPADPSLLIFGSRLPHRDNRTYCDALRPDFRDVTDLVMHTQFYLDPRSHRYLQRIIDPPRRVPLSAIEDMTGLDVRTSYLERLRCRGFHALSCDITTADVRAAGLDVVRALVPGLYANAPAAFPFLGGTRLYHEPAQHGWLSVPATYKRLVRTPMPFA